MLFVRFIRFVLVGGLSTVIQYGLLLLLVHLAGTDPVWASATGFVISAVANYLINYHYTFASHQRHVTALSKFAVLASVGLFLNSSIMSQLIHLGLHYFLSQVVATVMVLLWNFAGNSLWTFRRRTGEDDSSRGTIVVGRQKRFFGSDTMLLLVMMACVRGLAWVASSRIEAIPGVDGDQWARNLFLVHSGDWAVLYPRIAGLLTHYVGDPILLGQWGSFLAGTLCVIPFHRLVRRFFDDPTALIASIFIVFYGYHVVLSSVAMPEAPFVFFALWGMDRFFAETQATAPRARGFMVSGVLVALAGVFLPTGSLLAAGLTTYLLCFHSLRRFVLPFASISLSSLALRSALAGRGFQDLPLWVVFDSTHALSGVGVDAMKALGVWLWVFVQSPGPLLLALAACGLYMAIKRRLSPELAILGALLLGPDFVLSILQPEWALEEQRHSVLAGTLMLPYAAAATRILLQRKCNLNAAVVAILVVSVATQLLACQRHSAWWVSFHDKWADRVEPWNRVFNKRAPDETATSRGNVGPTRTAGLRDDGPLTSSRRSCCCVG